MEHSAQRKEQMQRACVAAELGVFKEQKESPLHGRNEVSEGELRDEVRNRGGPLRQASSFKPWGLEWF